MNNHQQNKNVASSGSPKFGTRFGKVCNPTSVFKVVNSDSKHQRQCKRFGDELHSRTLDRNKLSTQKHKLRTRLTFHMSVPATDKPEEALISIFTEFFQEIKKIDSSLAVLPWKDSDGNMESISTEMSIPT
jgi:hypothetical protein